MHSIGYNSIEHLCSLIVPLDKLTLQKCKIFGLVPHPHTLEVRICFSSQKRRGTYSKPH